MKYCLPVLLAITALLITPFGASAAPTVRGTSGLFKLDSGETLPKGRFNVALYADKYDRRVYAGLRTLTPGNPTPFFDRTIAVDTYEYSLSMGYGIFNWWEIGLQVPYVQTFADKTWPGSSVYPYLWSLPLEDKLNEGGIGDPILSLKFKFLNDTKRKIFMSAALEVKGPVGDEEVGLSTGEFDYGVRLAFTKNWRMVGLHLNGGYYFIGDPETKAPGVNADSTVDLENKIYGGLGFDFCPIKKWKNFKLILEFEGWNNTYEANQANRYSNDVLNGILGFRYFFTPKKYSYEEAMNKYSFSIGAGVRYAFMEEEPPSFPPSPSPAVPNKDGGSDNRWGFVAHVAFSPRLYTDMCKPIFSKPKETLSVIALADPQVFSLKDTQITADNQILDKNGNVTVLTSRIRGNPKSNMYKENEITLKWEYHLGDPNQTVVLLDGEGNPITKAEFDFSFDRPEDVTFIVTATSPSGMTATSEVTVHFDIQKTAKPILSIPIVYFDFDKSQLRAQHQQELENLAKQMTESYTELTLKLEGYTCPIGTTEYNLALGERRALAVKTYLEALGVPTMRLDWISYGENEMYLAVKIECRRADCLDKKEELSINRRTEVKVTGGIPPEVTVDPANLPGAIGGRPAKESGDAN